MRNSIILFVIVILISVNTGVQGASKTYVGVYVDENHNSWCVSGDPVYTVELWVWAFPQDSGIIGVTFYMSEPADILYGDIVKNPNLDPIQIKCKPPCPWTFIFLECQTDWVWLMHETLFINSSDQMTIELLPVDPADGNVVRVWDCEDNEHFGIKLTNVFINYDQSTPECSGVPVEPTSWTLIKRMFRD